MISNGTLRLSDCVAIANYTDLILPNSLFMSSKLIKLAQDYIEKNWIEVTNRGIEVKIARDVSEFSNEDYKDITIEPFLGGMNTIYAGIRLGDLGDGIQNYIIARMLYELVNPAILLWDNVEAHFNPRILVKIAEWFYEIAEREKQVVLTTHSLEATKIIGGTCEDFVKIYILDLKNGVLNSKEISVEEIEGEYEEAGIDVRMSPL